MAPNNTTLITQANIVECISPNYMLVNGELWVRQTESSSTYIKSNRVTGG